MYFVHHCVQMTIYTVSLIYIENKCIYDALRDLKREKKSGKRRDWTPVDRFKKTGSWFTICTTEADVIMDSSSRSSCTYWLTDVSSSQRWVIYSTIPLLRESWFVLHFSATVKAWCFSLFWNYFLDRGQKCKLTGQLLTDNTTLDMISWWTFTIEQLQK